jgi:hypothetical protein
LQLNCIFYTKKTVFQTSLESGYGKFYNHDCTFHSYGAYPQYIRCLLLTTQSMDWTGHHRLYDFHSGKSKAHLISDFTADAFNVPLVTINIFN